MIELNEEKDVQEVVNIQMKRKLWDQGYQQKIIKIEILKKKEKDIDCYITKK